MSSILELLSLLRRRSRIKSVAVQLSFLLYGREYVVKLRRSGTLDDIQHVNLAAIANINHYQGGLVLFTACSMRLLDDIRASEMLKIRHDMENGTATSQFIRGFNSVYKKMNEWRTLGYISVDDAEHCRKNISQKVNNLLGK